MDVALYHDEPCNRLPTAYEPQSSPGSVDSSSTDAGPVCAIAATPFERFGQEFSKAAALKVMNGQLQSSNHYNSEEVGYRSTSDSVIGTNCSYRQSGKSFGEASTSTSSDCTSVVSSAAVSTADVISMLKIGGPELDQMLTQYSSHTGVQMTPQVYSRSLTQQSDMYIPSYPRDLARQRSQGGSNPNIAATIQVATPPSSAITTSTNGAYEPNDPFYDNRQHLQEDPSTSGYGTPASTVHYLGDQNRPQHPLLMSHHNLKDDIPQTVPVMPKQSISPIDMEEQEIIKTERKRMRNRLAASKCRKRKLERISRLEEKVSNLKQQNLELSTNASLLRQQVAELKTKVMSHVNSGCRLMTSQPQVSF